MKALRLFFALALLTSFTVGTAAAADYYVFKNQHGQTLVLGSVPSTAWTRIDGPYATMDAAERASGTGTVQPSRIRRVPAPARAEF